MRRAYLLVAAAICAMGLFEVVYDLIQDWNSNMHFFRGFGALVGLAVIFTGMFHLLNYLYATIGRAIRGAAFGASVALLAAIVWASWGSWKWSTLVTGGLLALACVLSLAPAVRRPNQATPS